MKELRKSGRRFLAAAILAAAGLLTGCGGNAAPAASAAPASAMPAETGATDAADKKVSVIATIFPEYDWIRNIVGGNTDHVEIRQLLDMFLYMQSGENWSGRDADPRWVIRAARRGEGTEMTAGKPEGAFAGGMDLSYLIRQRIPIPDLFLFDGRKVQG